VTAAQEDDVESVQRQADVEAIIQQYANGEGRGRDIGYLRRWVQEVRRRRGPKAIITRVKITPHTGHTTYSVWHRYPKDPKSSQPGTGETRTDSVADIPTVSRARTTSSKRPDSGLTALGRSSATVPASSVGQRVPGTAPATQYGATAGQAPIDS
jgi:hypothetical protein